MESLFLTGAYTLQNGDDASTVSMEERYADIVELFPDDIKGDILPFFIDWLKYNVVLVEIVAYSDENAYMIFETMNDRGLNLTPTEMLKGFILSRFDIASRRDKANEDWKRAINVLKSFDTNEDQSFFQAWLRAIYAESIRPGKAGSQNEDFEKIGTRFHSWVRDNLLKMGLNSERPEDFERFVAKDFKFYYEAYVRILRAQIDLIPTLEHVYYIARWGIATSQSYPLMLAPLTPADSAETVDAKIDLVARYIETFVVRRSINFRRFSASSIRYTMYSLVKEIRGEDVATLRRLLSAKVKELDDSWEGMRHFQLNGQNKRFVKFLLSRMTAYIEQGAGKTTTFRTYYDSPGGKHFEVEHVWADKFEVHTDEFKDKSDFSNWRNSIGALVLLPRGTNQALSDMPYAEKIEHYLKENLLASSLCPLTYDRNPNFVKWAKSRNLQFTSHPEFTKHDITLRKSLYQQICEDIWAFPASDD